MRDEKKYGMNFRAYYENGHSVDHYEKMELKDIKKWIEAYQFTHKEVKSITVKIWLKSEDEGNG